METKEKRVYCSSCKHSKYEQDGFGRQYLRCYQREAFGQRSRIPKDCTDAEECLDYDPERWRDSLSSRHQYSQRMRDCGISLEEEKGGVLKDVRLE